MLVYSVCVGGGGGGHFSNLDDHYHILFLQQ